MEWDLHLNSVAQREREVIEKMVNQGLRWEKGRFLWSSQGSWAGKLELWSLFLCPLEDDMRTGRKEFLVKGHLFFTWFWLLLLFAICTRKFALEN